ncbi:MAG TPA: hotdog family protein [Methylibium sp.]|uniref:hotdog family protein n=1 Tax=Methylibium sp. TaxID=2067992 RepID=UPI002DB78784|nr:hotdog family protein [Methylibium sp.]HEU4458411.1 hotdog family protein [Methylibium sp.]
MSHPTTLDRTGIAARIPHAGSMCLLDRLLRWDATRIECRASSHRDVANPLRGEDGLPAVCAIEYAAQAMALHGGLVAPPGSAPRPGYIASVRQVKSRIDRLDAIDGELVVVAERLAGDASQVLYAFEVGSQDGGVLVSGRAAVVLDTPLATGSGEPAR